MKKLLTQRQAWLLLAKAWDKPKKSDGGYCIGRFEFGLCQSIWNMETDRLIDKSTSESMQDKVSEGWNRKQYTMFRWPCNTVAGARARAAFCRKQAAKLVKRKKVKR